ncbi:MAG: zf-HC2 domain-containing protein [Clostridiales bacterium]|nr:zf-HC2 domain-containing protein [Clostridiales bacterium]
MNCKETEKMIPAFLQDDLSNRELEEFIEHIKDCPECTEELSIQFLVSEGLERLEAGNNFNLQHALESRVKSSEHEIKVHRGLKYTLICLEAAVAAAIIIALVMVFKF